MPPTYKSFENMDIGPIARDGSLQWSPDNKYISIANTDHIVIVRVNTDMLKVPIPNFFHSKTNIEINKSHGTALANKIIPVKNFIKSLPMEEINRMVCDVRVDSEIFTSNADMKKFRWSPCSLTSNQSLIGALNSLGFLEIIHCHNCGHNKLFKINNLWYNQYVKKYLKMYSLPKLPSDLRKVFMNLCSLLWIESFIWVPMDNQADGLLLVCYHRRGVITVWNINQRLIAHDRFMVDVPVFGHTEMSPSSVKKKTNKEKSIPPPEPPSNFEHDCNLVKIITDYCDDPFSKKNLIGEEFIEKPGERVLNVEYINLNGKHTMCISRGNGTLELIELNLSDGNSFNNLPLNSAMDVNSTMNSLFGGPSLLDMSMDTTSGNEKAKPSRERSYSKGQVDSTVNGDKLETNTLTDLTDNNRDSASRKQSDSKTDLNEDQASTAAQSEANKKGIDKISEEEKCSKRGGRKRKLPDMNEDHGDKKTKPAENESTYKTNTNDENDTANKTSLEQTEGTNRFSPLRLNVYDKTDHMPIANLIITYTGDKILLIFNKLSLLHCIVLNKKGELARKFHQRIKTRSITAIAKHRKNTYLVATFENKLLIVRIDALVNSPADNDSHTPSNFDRIGVTRSIDMTNETHLLNGVANSQNNYLTVLSLKINVRFETYYASSRNPCHLLLTSLHSPSSLLNERVPAIPLYKQVDLIKCISYNNMNIIKHSLLDGVQDDNMKYFLLKLFKPGKILPKTEKQVDETLATLERTIFLKYIKKCVKEDIFVKQRDVLILFREWISHHFPADSYAKLLARLPTDPYEEVCVLCSSKTKVESARYALCSAGHRVHRCSLSLVQCLDSYVRCSFCMSYASKFFSEDPRMTCVFCNAKFSL